MKHIVYLLAIFFSFNSVKAQIIPANGSKLNYTQVMFEYAPVKGASEYQTELIEYPGGDFTHPLMQIKDSAAATLVNNLAFGKSYRWRYTGVIKDKKPVWNGPYNFEIVNDSFVDNSLYNINILKNDSSNTGGLIVVDYIRSAITRSGNAVWYLPMRPQKFDNGNWLRDLQLTPAGTFTFLTDSNAYECSLDGNIVWQAPNDGKVSGERTENYNHDFKKLANGHYMVLGNKHIWKAIPDSSDTTKMKRRYETKVIDNQLCAKIEFGTLIEYDKKGTVLWSWSSEKYLQQGDIFPPEELINDRYIGTHINSFNIDSTGKFILVGFRNISRIIKIDKASGEVVYSWGEKMPDGEARDGNGFFQKQHDSKVLHDGSIAVFNNGDFADRRTNACVVIFSQPKQNELSKLLWKSDCAFDTLRPVKSLNGGNVDELPNKNLLVCTGAADFIFEITGNKKVVWSTQISKKKAFDPTSPFNGKMFQLYRAHYTSSLYPCYFTCQADKDMVRSTSNQLSIKIFNKGTEEDSYLINTGEETLTTTTKIKGQTSATINLVIPNKTINGNMVEITISSIKNPELRRKLVLGYK